MARERKIEEEALSVLEGFSNEKAYLGRNMGSRVIYPVCRTVIFSEQDAVLQISVKDTSLLAPATKESTWQIARSEPISATLKKQKNKMITLTLSIQNNTVTVFMQDKYKTKELLEKYHSYITVDKEAIHTL